MSALERIGPVLPERVDAFGVRGAVWTATSLELPSDLPFAEYEAILFALGRARDMTAWALGDAIRFGEAVYGERYAQAVEATGRAKQTLMNYAWVSGRVPPSRRRAGLSWSHHEAVTRLKPRERDEWLDRAEAEQMSVEELRRLVRAPKDLPTSGDSDCDDRIDHAADAFRQAAVACYGQVDSIEIRILLPGGDVLVRAGGS